MAVLAAIDICGGTLSVLEIAANAVMALSIWLAARNSVHTWSTGIVGCLLFALVFLRSQLYADATLQLFFIATSLIGWWHWLHSNSPRSSGECPVTKARPSAVFTWVFAAVAVTMTYGWLLHRFTNAYMPYVDSAVLTLSVVAQCLLMQRKLETWPFWIAVNTISVYLFFSRGLWITGALYAAYWLNAWYGWWQWRQQRFSLLAVPE